MNRYRPALLAGLTLMLAALLPAGMTALAQAPDPAHEDPQVSLTGELRQGGLVIGLAPPGSRVQLDGQPVMVAADGHFLLGFGRDETGTRQLTVTLDGSTRSLPLAIQPREYNIERIDGLPPSTVTPDPSVLERIRRENAAIGQARARRDDRTDYAQGFIWPAEGRLSGFYGSQRVLNGEPRRPHYGLDIANLEGTPVVAPAAGIVTLAEADLYYSGGTVILDHGQGLSSTFLHLSKVDVKEGQRLEQGELIGAIGATGRATGPHLDWRINWLDRRLDPQPLLPEPAP